MQIKNMKKAKIFLHNVLAGFLEETPNGYQFSYLQDYQGPAISLTMPFRNEPYIFDKFPSFFDGLLPEGVQLEGLLKLNKLDRNDLFSQLICVGKDLVGAITIEECL